MNIHVRYYLSYNIKITLKSHFWHENIKILLLCLHNITKYVYQIHRGSN